VANSSCYNLYNLYDRRRTAAAGSNAWNSLLLPPMVGQVSSRSLWPTAAATTSTISTTEGGQQQQVLYRCLDQPAPTTCGGVGQQQEPVAKWQEHQQPFHDSLSTTEDEEPAAAHFTDIIIRVI
jgi:hypothetical protein